MFRQFRLFSEDEAREIASRLTDWKPGKIRAEKRDTAIKSNHEISPTEGDKNWDDIWRIKDAVERNRGLISHTLMCNMSQPMFNKYAGGTAYNRHFDASQMGTMDMRTDFSFTLYLNDGYEGGELTIESPDGHEIKAPPGEPGVCVVYDCTRAHWVTPVTRGERVSCIFWARSLIRDPVQRSVARDLKAVIDKWETEDLTPEAFGHEFTSLTGVHAQLCRMWFDT